MQLKRKLKLKELQQVTVNLQIILTFYISHFYNILHSYFTHIFFILLFFWVQMLCFYFLLFLLHLFIP